MKTYRVPYWKESTGFVIVKAKDKKTAAKLVNEKGFDAGKADINHFDCAEVEQDEAEEVIDLGV